MKRQVKQLLSALGWHMSRQPRGIVVGQDLWRDLGLLLEATPLCFDVGANHGDVSGELLLLRPQATIYAFEPSGHCQSLLQQRFGRHPRFHSIASGLGDTIEKREFHRYANDQLSSFLPLQSGSANPFENEAEIARDQIAVTTLDQFCSDRSVNKIDLLKIDTQGFDLRVLNGGERLFRSGAIRRVLVELDFAPLYQGQPAPPEIMSFLQNHGLGLVDFYEKCRREQRLAWCTALFAKI